MSNDFTGELSEGHGSGLTSSRSVHLELDGTSSFDNELSCTFRTKSLNHSKDIVHSVIGTDSDVGNGIHVLYFLNLVSREFLEFERLGHVIFSLTDHFKEVVKGLVSELSSIRVLSELISILESQF